MMRPTGIIRTLPSLYEDKTNVGHRAFTRTLAALERGGDKPLFIALSAIPKVEVLHLYILINGLIKVRLNIAEYAPGSAAKCFDKTIRSPNFWAVCTSPVSRPPAPIARRGFQGFRYTESLW